MLDLSPPAALEVSGTIDYRTVGEVTESIDRLIEAGRTEISLNCADADFFDSCGISLLARVGHSLNAVGGRLRVHFASPQLRHALDIAGFAGLVDLVEMEPLDAPRQIPVGTVHQRISLRVPPSADRDGEIRRRVMELAETMPFESEALDDIKLAVGEAVTNAVRHGAWNDESSRIAVAATADDHSLTVEITNPSEPFDCSVKDRPPADKLKEGGLGIYFMHACMDSVAFIFGNGTVTARMVRRLGADNGK